MLKQPDRHIPQFMEDLSDILLQLHFGKQTKSLAIEVANIKSYTLCVKLKSHVDIADLDFSQVTEERIDAKSPAFLLDELQKQFSMLAFADDYNMKQNLCENISFIFGSPDTGKCHCKGKSGTVSISRAKDYLFIIMPDDCTENINHLRLVKRVERLIKEEPCHSEMLAPHLEHMMFGSGTYLEDNTFSTGHQSVNVYGLPEKRYEIRSGDGAVDIQMHRPIASIATATNLVHSPRYGEGRIIATAMRDGTKRITVQFSRITETYDAEIAFRKKTLVQGEQ